MKKFNSFLKETHTSHQDLAVDKNTNMSALGDPSVRKKLNAWVGSIAGAYILPEEAISKLNDFERDLINDTMELNISHELKRIMDMIFNDCSDEIDFFSARKWCENITNNVFIIHGRNDSLSPFTESIKLDNRLQNSKLLISELFEHREISNRISFISKLKETFKIVNFLSRYYKEAFSI